MVEFSNNLWCYTVLLIKIVRGDGHEHIIYISETTEMLSGFYYSYVVGLFLLPNYRLYCLVSLDIICQVSLSTVCFRFFI